MTYDSSSTKRVQEEFLREELKDIKQKTDYKKELFQKIKYEITYLNKRKRLVEEKLEGYACSIPAIVIDSTPLGEDLTRSRAKVLVLDILRSIKNTDGSRVSEVFQYAERNYGSIYCNLSASRIRRAMVDLEDEKEIIATNPDNKKFRNYVISDKLTMEDIL